jgi:hypothetical protein
MSVLGVTLLWLAAIPCEGRALEAEQLTEVAGQSPEEVKLHLEAMELRWQGMPLRSPGDETAEARMETALRRMEAACARLEAAALEGGPGRGSDPALLKEILSRPEFAQARLREGDLLERLLQRVKVWLEELLQTQQAQSFAVGTRTAVLALAFAVVLFVALRLRRWRRGPAQQGGSAGIAAAALKLDSPGEHLSRARASLAERPREAIREGLLALLSSLEGRRLARPDRVKTNRELVAELPGRGASAQLTREVERLVRWYDRAFYSLAPVAAEDAARFVEEVERLHQGLAGATA